MTDSSESTGRSRSPIAEAVGSSIIDRLQARDEVSWNHIVTCYYPYIYSWCRRGGLRDQDAVDIAQEVFQALATALKNYRREEPNSSFHGWICGIIRHKVQDHWRRQQHRPDAFGGSGAMELWSQIPEPVSESLSGSAQRGEAANVVHFALEVISAEFEPMTWQAFWKTAVEDKRAADVAEELGMSTNAVYLAKSRVLRRLRQELDETC